MPPFVGVAVNVTPKPVQEGFDPPVTAIATPAASPQGAIVYENTRVLAALEPVVPPMYSLVLQNVTPSGSRVVCA